MGKIKRIEAILQANSSEPAGVTECTNIDLKSSNFDPQLTQDPGRLSNLTRNDRSTKVDMKADRTGKDQ